MKDIKITRLRIEAFGGLKLLEVDVPDGGVMFAGTKGEGKTSALRAVRAVVEGAGVDAGAIHLNEDKAILSIDFERAGESFRAKRSITRKGTAVELERSDGTPVPRAREQLRAIFGERSLDPLAIINADAKTRRKLILEALPCKVTEEDLDRWCEVKQPTQWSTSGHGHEVLARVRELYFSQRTAAKAKRDDLATRAKLAAEESARIRPERCETILPESARSRVAAAEKEIAVLKERIRAFQEREAETEETWKKIEALRARAEEIACDQASVPPQPGDIEAADKKVLDAEVALTNAKAALLRATMERQALVDAHEKAARMMADADEAIRQAADLEAAIGPPLSGDGDPISMQLAAAEEARREALDLVDAAVASQKWAEANLIAGTLQGSLREQDAEVERLERVVKRLSTEAPAELAKRSGAIQGLEITPTSILFEGKDIDRLSEGEKLILAVDLAKRSAHGSGVLCIDGLERIPPGEQPAFIRECLSGGWTVFATKVQDGPMEIVECYQVAGGGGQ